MEKNDYGLSRDIKDSIKQEIRRRSKYGCVICRCGIYHYEHIVPEWKDAKEHNPDNMCCLCGRCHDKVTRGFLSKDAVLQAYKKVQSSDQIKPPSEFFDFHTGEAKLFLGGMICNPIPDTIFEYFGTDVISLKPGTGSEPATISAIFTDDNGKECFRINQNEWIGKNELFDLEVTGGKFIVKGKEKQTILVLRNDSRIDPPGKIFIEHIDMRYEDAHILGTEHDIAIGRYNGHDNNLIWLHVKIKIDKVFNGAKAICIGETNALKNEYAEGLTAKNPKLILDQSGIQGVLVTDQILTSKYDVSKCGIYWPAIGFQIGKGCAIAICAIIVGVSSIEHARKHFFTQNRMNVPQTYLSSTGKLLCDGSSEVHTDKTFFKEPFLILTDNDGINKWEQRNKQPYSNRILRTPFKDDKPGWYTGFGNIRITDSYDGPLMKVIIKK